MKIKLFNVIQKSVTFSKFGAYDKNQKYRVSITKINFSYTKNSTNITIIVNDFSHVDL